MYSEQDIRVVDFRQHLIKHEHMYFGSRGANPYYISCHIVEAALVLGGKTVCITCNEDWWFICCDNDWLNAKNRLGTDEKNIFESLRAFPEGGENHYRAEIMAFYYSSALVIKTNTHGRLIKGNADDLATYNRLSSNLTPNQSILGFRFNAQLHLGRDD